MASSIAIRRAPVSTLFSKLLNLSPLRTASVATLAPSTPMLSSLTLTKTTASSTLSAKLTALSLADAILPVSSLMYLIHFQLQEA
ncbi:hypothetical protein HRI_001306900 [Hibiscus trionum]|uniref:Uncharacterized protein n=1 Tax=Hibiscus trionum TaxID=183268 RepID=A0A9W7HFM0_HIBTR|nr:hypothetical protein HRI_001306900 [Hibiscus trionum]